MSKSNSMLYQWFERVWHKGDESAIDELMEPNAVLIDPDAKYIGYEHVKSGVRKLRQDFENIHMEVGDVHSKDGVETAECIVTAMYKGHPRKIKGPAMVKVKNGKIVEASNDFDLRLYEEAMKL